MNRLFVAYKPAGIGSNSFLAKLKRKYGVKKAGFSGTLDPFAKGVLIIGFGSCTKLFRFLKKSPKTYRATLWLGLKSASLDTENVESVTILPPFSLHDIQKAVESLQGEISYVPPSFSAKKVNGKRAYDLAREGKSIELKTITSIIYDIKLLHYCHPFVTFEATVSEGAYIRSLGEMIAQKLGVDGALSALERLREGAFVYEDEKVLNSKEFLDLEQNFYLGKKEDLEFGRKIALKDLRIQKDGDYYIDSGEFLTIITIKNKKVSYQLGRVVC